MIDIGLVKEILTMDVLAGYYGFTIGRNRKALCPFHSDHSPSMHCYRGDRGFYCFSCGEHGDAIDFVAKMEGISTADALKRAAHIAGVSPLNDRETEEAMRKVREKRRENNRKREAYERLRERFIELTDRMNNVLRPKAFEYEKLDMNSDLPDEVLDFMDEYAEVNAELEKIDYELSEMETELYGK